MKSSEDFKKKYGHLHSMFNKEFEFEYEEELSLLLYLNCLNSNGDIDTAIMNMYVDSYELKNDLELTERFLTMKRASKYFINNLESIINNDAAKKMQEEINRRYKKKKK